MGVVNFLFTLLCHNNQMQKMISVGAENYIDIHK